MKDKLIIKWIDLACGNTIQMSNINKSISKKLLSFPLKLSSASAMLIKDQNAKVKWNMYVCTNMGYLARLAQSSSKLQWQGQTLTLGATFPIPYKKSVGSLKSPSNQCNEDARDGASGLSSLSKKLECPSICQCHSKGSIFSSSILDPVLVQFKAWPITQ